MLPGEIKRIPGTSCTGLAGAAYRGGISLRRGHSRHTGPGGVWDTELRGRRDRTQLDGRARVTWRESRDLSLEHVTSSTVQRFSGSAVDAVAASAFPRGGHVWPGN
eukprot:357087-Rhodomonas_salina.2